MLKAVCGVLHDFDTGYDTYQRSQGVVLLPPSPSSSGVGSVFIGSRACGCAKILSEKTQSQT